MLRKASGSQVDGLPVKSEGPGIPDNKLIDAQEGLRVTDGQLEAA